MRATLNNPWFRLGFKEFALMWPGILSWGMVTGVAMVKSGLSPLEATLISLTVFAGSAQLAAIPLMIAGASSVVVILTAFVMNLRFIIFSASLATYFLGLPLKIRLLAGYLNGDMGYALLMNRAQTENNNPEYTVESARAFHWGVGTSNWLAWQASSLIGIALGHVFPANWGLDFAAILALLALGVTFLKDRAGVLCVLVASAVALLTVQWPYRLGMVAALIAGIAAALAYNQLSQSLSKSLPQGRA
jgi:predicted branched-subunit amino acid permease